MLLLELEVELLEDVCLNHFQSWLAKAGGSCEGITWVFIDSFIRVRSWPSFLEAVDCFVALGLFGKKDGAIYLYQRLFLVHIPFNSAYLARYPQNSKGKSISMVLEYKDFNCHT